jgi:hypothetical protein
MEIGLGTVHQFRPDLSIKQHCENRLENILRILAAFQNAVCHSIDHRAIIVKKFVEVCVPQGFILRDGLY